MTRRQSLSASVRARLEQVVEAQRAGQFVALCQRFGLPKPELEYRFHPRRKWRLDFAWPEAKVYLECEGGIHIKGAHSTGKGIERDILKQNEAVLLGWRPLRVVPSDLTNYVSIRLVGKALGIIVPPLGAIK